MSVKWWLTYFHTVCFFFPAIILLQKATSLSPLSPSMGRLAGQGFLLLSWSCSPCYRFSYLMSISCCVLFTTLCRYHPTVAFPLTTFLRYSPQYVTSPLDTLHCLAVMFLSQLPSPVLLTVIHSVWCIFLFTSRWEKKRQLKRIYNTEV